MTGKTGFYTDERTFWHGGTAITMLTLPVGGWVQPPSGTVGVDTPDTKRRLLNLLRASGLIDQLDTITAAPVGEADLLRVHPAIYLARFKALSDAGGGSLGIAADFGPGGYEIAAISAGLAKHAVDDQARQQLRPKRRRFRRQSLNSLGSVKQTICHVNSSSFGAFDGVVDRKGWASPWHFT